MHLKFTLDNKVITVSHCNIVCFPSPGCEPGLLSYLNKGNKVYATFTTDDVVLKCEIRDGDPPATFTWYKDNGQGPKPITEDRYICSHDNNECKLTIKSAELQDNGNYIVKAKNQHGEVQTYCELRIFGNYVLSYSILLGFKIRNILVGNFYQFEDLVIS